MPRSTKGARLWFRGPRYDNKTGKLRERGTWIIRDGIEFVSTGCALEEIRAAEEKLAAYIAGKATVTKKSTDIEKIDVADVLDFYLEKTRDRQSNKTKLDERITRLAKWWGGKMLSEVTGETCEAFTAFRGSDGGARRDLQDLAAAINLHRTHGLHREVVDVLLPSRGQSRDRWLTRNEAARLLWVCWRHREIQVWQRGTRAGKSVVTDKRPLRHIARFILIGLYTGTRAGAISTASPFRTTGHSFVDLEAGHFHRLAVGRRATRKRQPLVRLPSRLLAHMRRWQLESHFIEWRGKPVKSVKTGFKSAVRLAGLEGKVHPHTLRHTAATWMMQNGVDLNEIAGFLGMTVKMLNDVYGHHHPDFQDGAAESFSVKNRKVRQKVGV
ncbi:site-specific integrase [Methylobacterium sp. Leaf102]|uniref:site-specific integrase n=1 Tax=Methylobacterium sp. Leaf102 TaxID=1736253 RepID=UPI0009E97DC9|nr:site-specific integrase [Methylobacterium sp. Leaf102]